MLYIKSKFLLSSMDCCKQQKQPACHKCLKYLSKSPKYFYRMQTCVNHTFQFKNFFAFKLRSEAYVQPWHHLQQGIVYNNQHTTAKAFQCLENWSVLAMFILGHKNHCCLFSTESFICFTNRTSSSLLRRHLWSRNVFLPHMREERITRRDLRHLHRRLNFKGTSNVFVF